MDQPDRNNIKPWRKINEIVTKKCIWSNCRKVFRSKGGARQCNKCYENNLKELSNGGRRVKSGTSQVIRKGLS